jgi:hypothetical protein
MFPCSHRFQESEVEGVREGVRRKGNRVGFSIYDLLGTLGTERKNIGWRPISGSKAVPTGTGNSVGNTGNGGNMPDGAEAHQTVTNRRMLPPARRHPRSGLEVAASSAAVPELAGSADILGRIRVNLRPNQQNMWCVVSLSAIMLRMSENPWNARGLLHRNSPQSSQPVRNVRD